MANYANEIFRRSVASASTDAPSISDVRPPSGAFYEFDRVVEDAAGLAVCADERGAFVRTACPPSGPATVRG